MALASARLDLLRLLVVREVRARYARTTLGVLWAVFPPLVTAGVFAALGVGRLLGGESQWRDVPYPAFVLTGLVFWTHFAQSLTSGTPSIAYSRDMLHKAAFPAELLPIAKVLAWLLDLAIGFAVLVLLLVVAGRSVPPSALLVPAVFALQLAFTVGVVLVLATLDVFFRDVQFVLQVLVPVLMFASGVVVPVDGATGTSGAIRSLNPVVSYVDAYRDLVLLGRVPGLDSLLPGLVGAVVSPLVGLACFRRAAPRFPEEV